MYISYWAIKFQLTVIFSQPNDKYRSTQSFQSYSTLTTRSRLFINSTSSTSLFGRLDIMSFIRKHRTQTRFPHSATCISSRCPVAESRKPALWRSQQTITGSSTNSNQASMNSDWLFRNIGSSETLVLTFSNRSGMTLVFFTLYKDLDVTRHFAFHSLFSLDEAPKSTLCPSVAPGSSVGNFQAAVIYF